MFCWPSHFLPKLLFSRPSVISTTILFRFIVNFGTLQAQAFKCRHSSRTESQWMATMAELCYLPWITFNQAWPNFVWNFSELVKFYRLMPSNVISQNSCQLGWWTSWSELFLLDTLLAGGSYWSFETPLTDWMSGCTLIKVLQRTRV